ncbi:PE family protein, partial [Mycobacterium tuberculosis]|uniref:PE family protein n=1 Tax=Mycobacterium tuberculosis TaxID=1773 RepID=UPI001F1E590E
MSFVIATPEMLTTAATDLAKIGSTITAANTAAAAVAKVLPASADEVSVAVAALFGTHAQEYQTVSAQVATFHDRFVQTLSAAASSYVAAEAVNVEQSLLAAVNAPTQALFGRPLIGNGADGSPGTGQAGGPGGILYGNGGNGGAGAAGAPVSYTKTPTPRIPQVTLIFFLRFIKKNQRANKCHTDYKEKQHISNWNPIRGITYPNI